jgi:ElaA protein
MACNEHVICVFVRKKEYLPLKEASHVAKNDRMSMQLISRPYSALSLDELYQLLKLRTDVFVVEQHCAYPELDDYDQVAQHILGVDDMGLVAYARVLPPESVYTQPSIGRVCVAKTARAKGYGHDLFKYALEVAGKMHLGQTVKIQAQTYLEEFYQRFGFTTITEPYLDSGIAHVDMLWEPEMEE